MKINTLLLAVLLPLASGALFSIGLAPFKIWPATFISIACLYTLLTQYPQFSKRISYFYGLGFFGAGVSWIYYALITVYTPPVISAISILCFCLGFALLFLLQGWMFARFFSQKSYSILSFALLWMTFEWIRTWIFTGFPWLFAGYSMTDNYVGQLASLFSVYGVSFMVVIFAVLLSKLTSLNHVKKITIISSFAALFLIGFVLKTLPLSTSVGTLKVAAVQSNVDQRTKWTHSVTAESREYFLNETYKLNDTNLIVWPEAALTDNYSVNQSVFDHLDKWATNYNTSLIAGAPRLANNLPRNSLYAVGNAHGIYDKQHLVPFGEYIPFGDKVRKALPFLNLNAYDYFAGDKKQAPITINVHNEQTHSWQEYSVGSVICYEAAYPNLVRKNAIDAQLILTVSNDDWFGDSLAPHQHLQIAQMRAIENRLSIIRSTQSGVTAFIDPFGAITHELPSFVPGTLIGDVSLNQSKTLYKITGHLYLMIISILLLIAIFFKSKTQS